MSISLGNLEVIAGLPQVKFGCSIDNLIGDVTAEGELLRPTNYYDLNFAGVKTITATNALCRRFSTTYVRNVTFPDLEEVSGTYAFSSTFVACPVISSVSFPKLEIISASSVFINCFQNITNSFTLDLSKLIKITGTTALSAMCYQAPGLLSFDMSSLEEVRSNGLNGAFNGCTGLTTVTFPKLKNIAYTGALIGCFTGCTNLTSISFGGLRSDSFGSFTNQFNTMLSNVTGCTVHFPSNLQSVIGNWTSVTAGFGGTNTTILYDLTATT